DVVSEAVEDAFRQISNADILMVFAAGNDGRDSDLTWWRWSMIDVPNLVAVTGVGRFDQQTLDFGRASTDLAAPTPEIITLSNNTNYTEFGGTSAACPHVVGATALLCAAKPDITVLELKSALFGSVDILPSLKGKTRTNGRLNVARALQ